MKIPGRNYLKNHYPKLYKFFASAIKIVSKFLYTTVHKFPKLWLLLKATIIGLPACVLSFATLKLPTKPPGQESLLAWIGERPIIVILIILWPIALQYIFALTEWFLDFEKSKIEMERRRFTTLYTGLEEVVGHKCNHVGEIAHSIRLGNPPTNREDAFNALIQPSEQIKILAKAVFDVTNHTAGIKHYSEEVVKIVLVEIANGAPSRFRVHYPENNVPHSSMLEEDMARKTLWARVAQSRRPCVIEDIAWHLSSKGPKQKLYCRSNDATNDVGSIAAIPILNPKTGNAVMVLSMKSSKPFEVCDDLISVLQPAIRAFTNRFLLEHNLEYIQGKMS